MDANKQGKVKICVLCGEPFEGYGNNPEPCKPYSAGKCCDSCNMTKVIPARLSMIM